MYDEYKLDEWVARRVPIVVAQGRDDAFKWDILVLEGRNIYCV